MTTQELETKLSDLLEAATDDGLDIDEIISALELAVIELKGEQAGAEPLSSRTGSDEEGFTED